MRALLERWAELEPAWCNVDDERASVMTDVGTPLERPRFTAQFHRLGQYEPLILASVIEAIEAEERMWDWVLRTSLEEYTARVSYPIDDVYRDGDTPAAALLGAYLAALEAEAGQ